MIATDARVADRYVIGAVLGRGSFATVYRAHDTHDDREVALKVLHDLYAHEPRVLLRFREEARTVAMLKHPSIVAVRDYGMEGGTVYLAMDLMEGGTLRERLNREGRIRPRDACTILRQLCAGLQAAHQSGIVHRDVKPDNVLFDSDGNAHLADFGLARCFADTGLTLTAMIVGSAKYLSPEQAMGMDTVPASDVYSLGAMLFEMLTGQAPYASQNVWGLLYQHAHSPAPRVAEVQPTIADPLAEVVQRALAKDLTHRFPDAGALREALDVLPDGVLEIEPQSPAVAPPSLSRLATGALAILVCSLSLFFAVGAPTPAASWTTAFLGWGRTQSMMADGGGPPMTDAQATALIESSAEHEEEGSAAVTAEHEAEDSAEVTAEDEALELAEGNEEDGSVDTVAAEPATVVPTLTAPAAGRSAPATRSAPLLAFAGPVDVVSILFDEAEALPPIDDGPESALPSAPPSESAIQAPPTPTPRPTVRPTRTPRPTARPTRTPRPSLTATPRPPTATAVPSMQQIQSRQFEGRLQRMTDSYLDVSGRRIYRDSQTRIDSNVRVGQEVKVTFVIENDRWLARRVQRD